MDLSAIQELYYGIELGELSIVEAVLMEGVDPNIDYDSLGTPLYFASQCDNLEIVKILLLNGADPNMGTKSPLSIAINNENLEIVKVLVLAGAKPRTDESLTEARHISNIKKYIKIVNLIEKFPTLYTLAWISVRNHRINITSVSPQLLFS